MSQRFLDLLQEGDQAYNQGDFDAAGKAFATAMAMRASNPQLLKLYADCCMRTGQAEAEWTALHRLLVLEPANKSAAVRLAALSAKTGRRDANDRIRRALTLNKGKGGLLGRLLRRGGKVRAPSVDGMDADQAQAFGAARDALTVNNFETAVAGLEPLADALPEDTRVLCALAEAYLGQSRDRDALRMIEKAIELGVDSVDARAQHIRIAAKAEQFDEAEARLAALTQDERRTVPAMLAEAALHFERDRPEAALALLDRVDATGDELALAAELRARVQAGQGQFDAACPAFEAWAQRAPMSGAPYVTAADNRLFDRDSALYPLAQTLAETPEAAQGTRAAVHFALARACKAAGDAEAEWAHLEQANMLVDAFYDPWDEAARIAAIRQNTGRELLARATDTDRGKGMIFVCGLPRSGSTLVAQVIAAHPEAMSIGEAQIFAPLVEKAIAAGYPENTAEIDGAFWAGLGQDYLAGLPEDARKARFVVDKELAKYQHLGLLHLMLPGARIIHCLRDPMDVCFSVFCQNFAGWPATFRQDTLAHFHHLHDEITAHWDTVLPNGLPRVRYEDMVTETEATIRRLLDAAGVPFHPDCLDFQTAGSLVRTASVYQVRQQIHTRSVGAWKRHEAGLQTLREGLENKPFS